ncbi:hypothetical protein M8C21_001499 [Ambrosia artemisiifolia]|uniref:Uncharacterized protein n=1 Tax=Ambrosia artemisiifolia TaxID=4212 RepID=A0AAD5G2W2_AMBAR|nr:hypothetical protein M8C21_001499 [Ambrosia artemisiifolia]
MSTNPDDQLNMTDLSSTPPHSTTAPSVEDRVSVKIYRMNWHSLFSLEELLNRQGGVIPHIEKGFAPLLVLTKMGRASCYF